MVFVDNIVMKRIPEWKKDVLKKDQDKFILIDGREGSGKSVFAQQLASTLDKSFCLEKICFNADEFINIVKDPKRKSGDCIVLDEAFSAANARQALSNVNRAMIAVSTEMRQLNLFVVIVLPTFFDLDRYFAIWRTDTLFHVYFNKKKERGRYIIFPFNKKKLLYLKGKKEYDYNKVKSPYPPCRFFKEYTVDELEYRRKKEEAFRRREKKVSPVEKRYKEALIKSIQIIKENMGWSDEKIGKMLDYTKQNINLLRKVPLCPVKTANKLNLLL